MATNTTKHHHPATAAAARDGFSPYDLVIGLLAVLSLIVLALVAFAPLAASTKDLLNTLEVGLCFVFLFDFLRSLFRAHDKWGYVLRGGGWLDLLGSIPFSAFAIFRIFRLLRVVRVMRTLRGSELSAIVTERLAESALLFTLVFALIVIFVMGAIVAWAEHGAPHSNIETYPEGVWWAVVTITTVGYGDYYPVTTVGRVSAAMLMFCGLGIIGVLSSYLATTFISLQARRAANRREGEAHSESTVAKDRATGEDAAAREATDLAAIREELEALRTLLEERTQIHEPPQFDPHGGDRG